MFSFRKEHLHYVWTIEDAETVFLKMRRSVKSPKFNIPGVKCDFHYTISISPNVHYGSNDYRHNALFSMSSSADSKNLDNVWVMSSSFSLLNPLTGSMQTHSRNNIKMKDMSCSPSYKPNIFNSYLHDKALTLQVTATFLLLDHPEQSVVQIPPAAGFGEKMKQMHEKNLFTDVKIVVQDKTFNVHRAVLAAHSPVFEKMFENDTKENLERKIEIRDMDCSVVEDLIAFMYTGCVSNVKYCHQQLLLVADKYNIQELEELCLTELKKSITPSNVVEILSLVGMIPSEKSKSLKECCLSNLKQNNAIIYKSKEWKQFKESSPEFVIEIMEELTL